MKKLFTKIVTIVVVALIHCVPMQAMKNSESATHYIFSSGSEYEEARLKRLNEVYNPTTKLILTPYLRPGMQILEIGPGNGEIGAWMIETAGGGNKIYSD